MEQVIHFILDTAGIGGLIVTGVLGGALLIFFLLTRWILRGGAEETVIRRRLSRPPGFRR